MKATGMLCCINIAPTDISLASVSIITVQLKSGMVKTAACTMAYLIFLKVEVHFLAQSYLVTFHRRLYGGAIACAYFFTYSA